MEKAYTERVPNSFDGSYFLNSAAGGSINANCRSCPTKDDSRGQNVIKKTRLIKEGKELILAKYGAFVTCKVCLERDALDHNIVGCGCSEHSARICCKICTLDFFDEKRMNFEFGPRNKLQFVKKDLSCELCREPVSSIFLKRVDAHIPVSNDPPSVSALQSMHPVLDSCCAPCSGKSTGGKGKGPRSGAGTCGSSRPTSTCTPKSTGTCGSSRSASTCGSSHHNPTIAGMERDASVHQNRHYAVGLQYNPVTNSHYLYQENAWECNYQLKKMRVNYMDCHLDCQCSHGYGIVVGN